MAGIVDGHADRTFGPAETGEPPGGRRHGVAGGRANRPGRSPTRGSLDVGPGHPFRTPIAWAASVGVVDGYPDDRFRPTDPVTRQSMAAVVWRWQGRPAAPPVTFPDVGWAHPFHDPVAWMAGLGITTGYPDGRFRPTTVVSRQSAVAFLHRLLAPQ